MELFEELTKQVTGKNKSIVFPEAQDERILGAASRLHKDGILEPVLLGNIKEVKAAAEELSLDIDGIKIIDPNNYSEFDEMVQAFVDRRKGKATEEQAREMLLKGNYFGTMLVYMNKVDGMVSGAVQSTADTVRPALQIIKTREDVNLVSGAFLMLRDDERYVFADAAINLTPNPEQLAEIAVESAKTADLFGIEPKVALLSFSTHGSASGEQVEHVQEATRLAKEANSGYSIDGEMQFDAALVPSVAETKAPDSDVAGQANVFIFPDLQSGNIGYKIAQRFGGFEAVGPILQGLNMPVSDLSRGCSEEDAYKTAILTAKLALLND